MLGYELLGVGFAFGVVCYWEVDYGGGIALGGFHDCRAVGVGYIGDLIAELLKGVADGDCAGRTVSPLSSRRLGCRSRLR